ncbi:GntR family transcriptional regulator [Streptomyces sp. NPDC003393]
MDRAASREDVSVTSTTSAAGRPGTLADQAYRAIADRLVTLRIRPGQPVDDDRIAAELGFGRTPVREALKRLEHERRLVGTQGEVNVAAFGVQDCGQGSVGPQGGEGPTGR